MADSLINESGMIHFQLFRQLLYMVNLELLERD